MATTVANLVTSLDVKLGPYADASCYSEAQKIAALNGGKQKVWAALTAAAKRGGTNWFALEGTATITAGDREVTLPDTVHDVLSVHAEGVKMRPGAFHQQLWREQRRVASGYTAATFTDGLLWIATGSNPPVIRIGPKLLEDLDLIYHYNQMLAAWTATENDADVIPEPYHEDIVNYAAWTLVNAIQDSTAPQYWNAWTQGIEVINGAAAMRTEQAGAVDQTDYSTE